LSAKQYIYFIIDVLVPKVSLLVLNVVVDALTSKFLL